MWRASVVLLLAGLVSVSALGASPPAAKTSNPDQWRYAYFNGDWWYWLPENRWVYWRDGRWNDFPPTAPAQSLGPTVGRRVVPPVTQNEDIRPFYGHAQSRIDYGPSGQEEIGPFYGHALPADVFGWRGSRPRNRPYYGHADSSYMY